MTTDKWAANKTKTYTTSTCLQSPTVLLGLSQITSALLCLEPSLVFTITLHVQNEHNEVYLNQNYLIILIIMSLYYLCCWADFAVPSCLRSNNKHIQLMDASSMLCMPYPPFLGDKRHNIDLIIAMDYCSGEAFRVRSVCVRSVWLHNKSVDEAAFGLGCSPKP